MLIKGHKGQIALDVKGYENPHASDPEDRKWLRATLEVHGGPFYGSIAIGLTIVEIERLYRLLEESLRTLNAGVHFVTVEGNWTINMGFERTGAVVVTGTVTPDEGEGNALNYQFSTDPITLESAVLDLSKVVRQYSLANAAI